MTKHVFNPDYIVPPGATLKEILESKGMSQTELALRLGMAEKTVSQIINGIAPISFDTSEKLELVTGVSAKFWNRRELSYREGLARQEEAARFETDKSWLKEIPFEELIERGIISARDTIGGNVRSVLGFFGVSSVDSWRDTWISPAAQYHGNTVRQKWPGFVAAWLRIGELLAQDDECAPFDAQEFRHALSEIRDLTVKPASIWQDHMQELCRSAGVSVVFVPSIPRASVSGCTRWLTKDRAIIQLSLKYKTDDQLWFTFFHEAGHVLLHSKKLVYLNCGITDDEEDEREANKFAQDILIPPSVSHRLAFLRGKSQIRQFAKSINIAPGIVVGRLQREELLPPSHCNDLKRKLKWAT